ncbi:hypothetical protein [Dactylosporangium maewongense]
MPAALKVLPDAAVGDEPELVAKVVLPVDRVWWCGFFVGGASCGGGRR